MVNQAILEWQSALPSFGIPYQGPKDGKVNQSFLDAMMSLEGKYKAYGQIFVGDSIRMSVADAKKKFMISEAPKEIVNTVPKSEDKSLKIWESFLSTNLPVVGKVYDGNLASAAKKIEDTISKIINKPVTGMVWDDTKKQFNTTPDDIKKALDLIQTHTFSEMKNAEFTMDQRVVCMSRLLL